VDSTEVERDWERDSGKRGVARLCDGSYKLKMEQMRPKFQLRNLTKISEFNE